MASEAAIRALILAYDFPPYVSVGGLRPYSWYRYLPEYGVEPVVVTRQWENHYGGARDYVAPSHEPDVVVETSQYGTLVRSPYKPTIANRLLLRFGPSRLRLARRAITAAYEVAQYHLPLGPKRPLYGAARRYLASRGADVIVATGDPFVLFHYAALLSREFGTPWIADYRDAWSHRRLNGYRLPIWWERRLERRTLCSARAITVVSPAFLDPQLLAREIPIRVVPNGFDPEAMVEAAGTRQSSERLVVGFAGRVCPWHPIEGFLRACAAFAREVPDGAFEVLFLGVSDQPRIQALAAEHPELAGRITFVPPVPNADVPQQLSRANVLVAFNNYRIPGTKIYDYLALKRRILLCYTDDLESRILKQRHYIVPDLGSSDTEAQDVISETDAGVLVRDGEHLRQVLLEARAELVATGKVSCRSHGIERYSRRLAASRLAELIRESVARARVAH